MQNVGQMVQRVYCFTARDCLTSLSLLVVHLSIVTCPGLSAENEYQCFKVVIADRRDRTMPSMVAYNILRFAN